MLHLVGLIAAAEFGPTIGHNILHQAKGLAIPIYTAIVILVAVSFLPGRKHRDIAMFFIAAIAIGAVVADPEGLLKLSKSMMDAATSGL